ncbi:carboxypeptidase-like regulatory domain-containing protein [Limibacterium fermenti]|uniref:carboxypeptidase-like regulatory domain-containing protein n=1 Tax=Limibacterium fermenti TaxID=3229863 RepID=UPI003A6ED6A6
MKEEILNLVKGMMFLLVWTLSIFLFAQAVTVKGTVTDAKGEPLIGVSVKIQGTGIGTITDSEDNFILSDAPSDAVLEVLYVGMLSQTVTLDGKTTLTVVLQEDTEALEEDVVIGYGTQKKADLMGSVANINIEKLNTQSNVGIGQVLQGKIDGVDIVSQGGTLGGSPHVMVRGIGTLNNSSPLYLVS